MRVNELAKIRKRAGLTQVQLAKRAACSQGDLSRWERGTPCVLSAKTVSRIEHILWSELARRLREVIAA